MNNESEETINTTIPYTPPTPEKSTNNTMLLVQSMAVVVILIAAVIIYVRIVKQRNKEKTNTAIQSTVSGPNTTENTISNPEPTQT